MSASATLFDTNIKRNDEENAALCSVICNDADRVYRQWQSTVNEIVTLFKPINSLLKVLEDAQNNFATLRDSYAKLPSFDVENDKLEKLSSVDLFISAFTNTCKVSYAFMFEFQFPQFSPNFSDWSRAIQVQFAVVAEKLQNLRNFEIYWLITVMPAYANKSQAQTHLQAIQKSLVALEEFESLSPDILQWLSDYPKIVPALPKAMERAMIILSAPVKDNKSVAECFAEYSAGFGKRFRERKKAQDTFRKQPKIIDEQKEDNFIAVKKPQAKNNSIIQAAVPQSQAVAKPLSLYSLLAHAGNKIRPNNSKPVTLFTPLLSGKR